MSETDPGPDDQMIDPLGIADVELRWGAPVDGLSDALRRRELALGREGRADDLVRPTRVARPASARMGRPRKLSRYDELQIAIFVATRRLEGRAVKNALVDAGNRFDVSRAAVTRAERRFRRDAAFVACALKRAGRKRFRKIVTLAKPFQAPSFRDWSADEK